ncbi:hypothetical protein IMZ48_34120 [Candidatus Bathyarchaeota archaeon]|nr:hypothetical protein [Candidatus Bathyarchaeota archaeon]
MTRPHQQSPDSSHYAPSHPTNLEPQPSSSPRYTPSHSSSSARAIPNPQQPPRSPKPSAQLQPSATGGASRFPSPPSSSSPGNGSIPRHSQNAQSGPQMPPAATDTAVGSSTAPAPAAMPSATSSSTPPRGQQPSPSSDSGFTAGTPANDVEISDYPQGDPQGDDSSNAAPEGRVIHIRDLSHIQSLVKADLLSGSDAGILNDAPLQQMKYDISGMPITDVIEMVAALLTKITSTNDLQHDAIQRNATHQQQASQNTESGSTSNMSPLSTSVLAFHGKNVPAITILSYLSRIHRYCPTTYEVFLSLLVYFDRMTERVNDRVMRHEDARRSTVVEGSQSSRSDSRAQQPQQSVVDTAMADDSSGPVESDSDLADDDDEMEDRTPSREPAARSGTGSGSGSATYFVVDSFNIHRLIISGVTCASKFFSDVFYTNSRYAKVCLPRSSLVKKRVC